MKAYQPNIDFTADDQHGEKAERIYAMACGDALDATRKGVVIPRREQSWSEQYDRETKQSLAERMAHDALLKAAIKREREAFERARVVVSAEGGAQ